MDKHNYKLFLLIYKIDKAKIYDAETQTNICLRTEDECFKHLSCLLIIREEGDQIIMKLR